MTGWLIALVILALFLLLKVGVFFHWDDQSSVLKIRIGVFRFSLSTEEKEPKKKKGKGFPSRHVFSLFLITVMSFPVLPILSSVLLILGIALAVSRVLLGIHFLRDVIAGAAIGIASGGIGLLVLWLI